MSSPFVAVRAVVRPSGPASFLPSLREHTHTLSLSLSSRSSLSTSSLLSLSSSDLRWLLGGPIPNHDTRQFTRSPVRDNAKTRKARDVCVCVLVITVLRPQFKRCVSQHRVWSSGHCVVPLLLRTQQPAPELASINIFCSLAEKTTCGAGKVTKPNTQTQDAKSTL